MLKVYSLFPSNYTHAAYLISTEICRIRDQMNKAKAFSMAIICEKWDEDFCKP